MNELLELKRNAMRLGLCGKYTEKWNAADSKEALMNMATDANGADFLAMSLADGWGLTSDFIRREFGDYINGKWQRNDGGYTSELYVDFDGDIEQKSTLTTLLDCKATFYVPRNSAATLYVSGESEVVVRNDSFLEVTIYGDKAKVSRHPWSKGEYKEIIVPKSKPHLNP